MHEVELSTCTFSKIPFIYKLVDIFAQNCWQFFTKYFTKYKMHYFDIILFRNGKCELEGRFLC